jgi:CTP:molybdopterin cytidylyltransferase MocA
MDCIILVGNRANYREVARQENKAFLSVGGRTILHIMLTELARVQTLDRFFLVGSVSRLRLWQQESISPDFPKPIVLVEQGRDLLENVLAGSRAALGDPLSDDPILVLPSDIPLVTAAEVRQFMERADMTRYDLVTGVTTEATLSRFYPAADKPGVMMQYFNVSSGHFRVNNMHMVRPAAIANIEYIRRMYAIRYQRRFINGLLLMWNLMRARTRPGGLLFYAGLRLSSRLRLWNRARLAARLERHLHMKTGEYHISKVLGARFKVAVTTFGGSAIDVDNDETYRAVCSRFEDWLALQHDAKATESMG